MNSNQGNELEQHGHNLLKQGNKFLTSMLCVGLSWNKLQTNAALVQLCSKWRHTLLIFDFSWRTSGSLSGLWPESERSCWSARLKARSVYAAFEIVAVYLRASLWELQLEFSPKGASNVWKENRDRVGLRAQGNFSNWEAKGKA